jgi:hypothetical protein
LRLISILMMSIPTLALLVPSTFLLWVKWGFWGSFFYYTFLPLEGPFFKTGLLMTLSYL